MNKKRVNDWILPAKKVLENIGIAQNGKVDKTFRSQISSFGAAVVMGSLKSAVAFFSEQGGATVAREKLIQAMYCLAFETETIANPQDILEIVCKNNSRDLKEKFIDASIALKLAMNFFVLE